MGTLSDYSSPDTIAKSKAGTFTALGAKPVVATKDVTPRPSVINQFTTKVSDVATQSADIAASVAGKTANFVKNTPKYIYQDVQPLATGLYRAATYKYTNSNTRMALQQDEINRRTDQVYAMYKSGKINKENFSKLLGDINKTEQEVVSESKRSQGELQDYTTQIVKSGIMTAADVLSLGKLSLAKVGGKQALEAGSKEAIAALIEQAPKSKLEELVLRAPVVRSLLERNLVSEGRIAASEGLAQYLKREGGKVAAGLLIKRPVFYQSNMEQAQKTLHSIATGNYPQATKDAAWIGIQMLDGGPIGAAGKLLGTGKSIAGKLAYGKGSLIDEMSARIGNGSRTQIADLLTSLAKKGDTPVDEGKIFYHGTNDTNLKNLSDLKAGRDIGKSGINMTYVTENEDIAKNFGNNVISGKIYGKHLDISKLGNNAWDPINVPEDLADYKTTKLLSDRDRRVFEQQYLRGQGDNRIIDATPDIQEYLRSKGYSTVTVPRVGSDVNGARTETVIINKAALNKPRQASLNFKEVEDALKIMAASGERIHGKDVGSAADTMLATFAGRDLSTVTPREILETQLRWKQANDLAQTELKSLVSKGVLTAEEASRYTPVRWDAGMRDAAANIVKNAGLNPEDQWRAVQQWAESAPISVSNNQNLMDRIHYEIFKNAGGADDAARAIQAIDAAQTVAPGVTGTVKSKLAKLGYVLAEPAGGRPIEQVDASTLPKLISAAARDGVDMFDKNIAPQPIVAEAAGFLKKIGLSPEATTKIANQKLAESVVAELGNAPLSHDFATLNKAGNQINSGQAILSKLQNYVENMKGNKVGRILTAGTNEKSAVTDIRQLRPKEIVEALSSDGFKLSSQDAKLIQRAVVKGYTDIPLELRGAGDRVVDWLYRINPVHKYYSRIQSALRYTYNPFFRVQEGTETFIGAGAFGGNRATHLLHNMPEQDLNTAVQTLRDSRIFSSSFYGEGAQDVLLGRLSANISKGQEKDLAALALDMASRQGKDLQTLLNENPEQIADALRVIVQYPQKGILASPLARTMNLIFFPIRYNTKVTVLAAQVLGKQPPVIQSAVLHSLFNFDKWLKSDEGIRWQQRHADAIQVFNWLTPINSIEATLGMLNGIHAPGDLGSLGGLPLGVITQVMDSLGIIHLNTPYVNPKTGAVVPKYIPQTTKAQAATALTELLGTMFTYPGRTLGLPGKQESLNKLVKNFIDTNGKDFIKQDQMDRLTPLQQNWVRVLNGDTSKEAVDALYNSPAPGNFNWYTLPPLAVPVGQAPPVTRRQLAYKAAKGKKAKAVAQPISR